MENERRSGLSESEMERLAERIVEKMSNSTECRLTSDQQEAIINFLALKEKTAKATLWFMGALVLWVLKDVYGYIAGHSVFSWR